MYLKNALRLLCFLLLFFLLPQNLAAATYYVDSNSGNDSNSCSSAQNTSSPRKSVNGIMQCNPGAGDIVKLRGTFNQTISPNRSGQALYPFQAIQRVEGSAVTFSQSITGLNRETDMVTVYGSRKGNSGAFEVVSVSGNTVTVNTAALPAGRFIPESQTDPGDLYAAIVRPLHFTAWDQSNLPIFNSQYQTFYSNNQSVVMASYLHSISGTTTEIWPAFEIDSPNGTNSDYIIFDHLNVENAATGIAVEFRDFQSNYNIIQHNNLHDIGYQGGASDEVIYYGNAYHPERHHDYVQIMYNKIGPHRFTTGVVGDGIEVKPSAHNPTIFGNEIVGIIPNGCDDAPIKTTAINSFIANNYLHDINPPERLGCGISVIDDYPNDSTGGADNTIVANNIIANVERIGIRVLDTNNAKVLNNTIYNIFPEAGCTQGSCLEENMGIMVQNWEGSTQNLEIKNNIIHTTTYGIGRYLYSSNLPFSIDSNNNLIFNTQSAYHGSISQGTNDLLTNPGLVNPAGGNFAISSGSIAINKGASLTQYFSIDNHDAANPTWSSGITPSVIRSGTWDIGAYEYDGTTPSAPPSPTSTPRPTSTPASTPTATTSPGCAFDINNDGIVNGGDISIILSYWRASCTSGQAACKADLNNSGRVETGDIASVIYQWGTRCQ